MGQVAARLDRHDKAVRRLGPPRGERVRGGEAVERAVVLDRAIPARVVLQPVALREARRVEHAPPVAVLPARGTDPNRHRRDPASFPPLLPPYSPPMARPGRPSSDGGGRLRELEADLRTMAPHGRSAWTFRAGPAPSHRICPHARGSGGNW